MTKSNSTMYKINWLAPEMLPQNPDQVPVPESNTNTNPEQNLTRDQQNLELNNNTNNMIAQMAGLNFIPFIGQELNQRLWEIQSAGRILNQVPGLQNLTSNIQNYVTQGAKDLFRKFFGNIGGQISAVYKENIEQTPRLFNQATNEILNQNNGLNITNNPQEILNTSEYSQNTQKLENLRQRSNREHITQVINQSTEQNSTLPTQTPNPELIKGSSQQLVQEAVNEQGVPLVPPEPVYGADGTPTHA